MALANVAALKLVLRKQSNNEDTLLAALIASAIARVQGYLRRPIEEAERTFTDETPCAVSLIVPITPVGELVSVKDANDFAFDVAELRIGKETGLITWKDGSRFYNGPFEITCKVGLALRADYATLIEPVINQGILDTASDLYHTRNPRTASDAAGGGVSTTLHAGNDEGVPLRVAAYLAPYRMVGVS